MNDRGLLASFLVCKIAVALAALTLLSAVLSMYASSERLTEREELTQFADAVTGAIETADSLPAEAEIRRALPRVFQQFEVRVEGERNSGLQVIHVSVIADVEVERVLMVANQVNGGEFTIAVQNPSEIHLTKTRTIQLELI